MAILAAVLKIMLPLFIIAGVAYFIVIYQPVRKGSVRVTATVPGADILVGGLQTGFVTDTTIDVPAGRQIITVRKGTLVSDPEFIVLEMKNSERAVAHFSMRAPQPVIPQDTIPPLQAVRQEVFSTGEPVHAIPPAVLRSNRRLVDFSQPDITRDDGSRKRQTSRDAAVSPITSQDVASLQGTQVSVTSTPPDAEIWVNGALTARVTPYTFHGLDRGLYSFRVRRDGYVARPESVTVALQTDFENELISFDLISDASLPQPKLVISTTPIAAGIRVDNKQAGIGQITMDAGWGNHRIEFANVAGYKTPASVTTMLTEDQPNAVIVGEYKRLSGDGFIAVRPSDDLRKFDPSQLRIYVDNELILDGADRDFDAALLGHLLSGKRLLRIHYGDLSNDIHVHTMDGQVAEITFRVESFFSKRRLSLRDKSVIPVEEWRDRVKKLEVLTIS